MKQILQLFFCLLAMVNVAFAQDPIYSQFFSAPIQLNPGLVGTTLAPRVALNYRNQWSNFPNAYTTYSVSVEQFLERSNSGIGLMVLADNAGDGLYKTNSISAVYAYRIEVARDMFLKGGIEIGVTQNKLDWDRFVFLDQIDAIEGPQFPSDETRPPSLKNTFVDFSTGLLFYTPRFYGGITLKHLNTPDNSFLTINDNLKQGLPMRIGLHAGGEISLNKRNKGAMEAFISPNVLFLKQGEFMQINAGAYIGLGAVYGGAWYRLTPSNGDAAILLLGLQKGIFKIGYSFDFTTSNFGIENGGSHEISIILNFDADDRRRVDYNDCFKIFR